ncbi:hypothetical protein TcCL_Unassigned05474 [Trypanosoma cruzi]|nr:hypothetical protein TcCL_Unassigned05474 [Trypanosoma cruzi]
MHVCLPCGCGVFDPYFTLFGAAEVDGEVMQSRAARAWWKRLREPVEDPSKSKCTMRFGSTGKEETVGGLGELQCTRLQKMKCIIEFTLTTTWGPFLEAVNPFLFIWRCLMTPVVEGIFISYEDGARETRTKESDVSPKERLLER